jgi:hypothetical protein
MPILPDLGYYEGIGSIFVQVAVVFDHKGRCDGGGRTDFLLFVQIKSNENRHDQDHNHYMLNGKDISLTSFIS